MANQSFKIIQKSKEPILPEESHDILEQKEPEKVISQTLYKIVIFYSENTMQFLVPKTQ